MSTLLSSPSPPAESNGDHSHFFANSDDDADTASQRSISLSSGPSSPKPKGSHYPSSPAPKTPMKSNFAQQSASPAKLSENANDPIPPKEHGTNHNGHEPDHETSSATGTRTSGPPSAVTLDDDSTRPSSMSSRTSFHDHDEDTHTHKHDAVASSGVETTYPPQPLVAPSNFNYTTDPKAADQESVLSAASSMGTGVRKTRPESVLIEAQEGSLVLGIALVDFNHIVGPRVEFFEGSVFEDEELIRILPFLALPDGAHLSSEDYSYFHVVPSGPKPTTIFGISCNRQIAAAELLSKGEDVTRSMVQKAVIVLATKPISGAVRDKLGIVTNAYFNQRDFRDSSILTQFMSTLENSLQGRLTESALYMGTSVRELVHKFRHRTLILLKALILQKKIMFYGHPVERLCTYQYSLVSLIPMLLQSLEDCGSPPLAARASTLSRPTSLRTSDRKSLLNFVGLPLDVFGKDAFFQPYLPLQQVDIAKDTNSWLCGCTNSIVYTQSSYDILVNIETSTFEFQDAKLEKLVGLTPADRKWIDDLVKDVNEGWSETDPTRPAGMQFKGSDDYLRTKFEEYISAALATIKYSAFLAKGDSKGVLITEGFGTESQQDFSPAWIAAFKLTQAFETWDRITDPILFDIVEPRHPCVDKPTAVADIGLRLSEGVRELKIDQQLAPTREALSSVFTTGSTNFFKAVDGIKGRWPVSRTSSATPLTSASPTSPSTASSAVAHDAKPLPEDSVNTNSPTPSQPSVFASSSTSFFKAVDGIKGRWSVSRTPNTTPVKSASPASQSDISSPSTDDVKPLPERAADGVSINSPTPTQSSVFTTGSTSFFKAVDGIKNRWSVSRAPSSTLVKSPISPSDASSPVADDVKSLSEHPLDSVSINSPTLTQSPAPPTPPKEPVTARPPSVVAAQVTSDAKAAIGAWGTSVGSFFATRARGFSFSRRYSTSVPTPISPTSVPPPTPEKSVPSPPQTSSANMEPQGTVAIVKSGEQDLSASSTANVSGEKSQDPPAKTNSSGESAHNATSNSNAESQDTIVATASAESADQAHGVTDDRQGGVETPRLG